MHRKRQPFMRINSSAERLPGKSWSAPVLMQNTALTPKGVKEFILNLTCVTVAREHGFKLPCRRCSAVEEVMSFL